MFVYKLSMQISVEEFKTFTRHDKLPLKLITFRMNEDLFHII